MDGERHILPFRLALILEGGCRTERSIEGEIVRLVGCGAGLDIAAAFLASACVGPAACGAAREPVKRRV
jgi:hypothetical protein